MLFWLSLIFSLLVLFGGYSVVDQCVLDQNKWGVYFGVFCILVGGQGVVDSMDGKYFWNLTMQNTKQSISTSANISTPNPPANVTNQP